MIQMNTIIYIILGIIHYQYPALDIFSCSKTCLTLKCLTV